jgi:hypothetical protein
MSDTNTDTNDDAIKKKKKQSSGKTDVGEFIKNFALSMVGIILFIIFGTSWLYIAKLSTAKIIPIDTYFEPYTCKKNVEFGSVPIKVPMNTMSELDFKGLKFWGEPIGKWEQEATFSSQGFIKSFNHSFINNLRKKTDNPASSSNYDKFKSILINNIVGTGFWLYDKISIPDGIRMMPDSLKIVIYGLFGVMFFPIFWIWNGTASFYYTIMTLSKGEEDNPNDGGYDGGLFDGVDALKNGDSLLANFGKALLRFFVWIPIWLIVIPVLTMFVFPAIGTFYPFFKMLFSSGYKLKEYDPFKADKQSDSKSFLDFIKDNLVYKRTLILVFAILNLFTCANKYLGENYFTAVVLATILGVIFGNIFVNSEPDDATMISVKETVDPVIDKPAPLDDECEEYQDEVIDAWSKLKRKNQYVSNLIDQYPGYIKQSELNSRREHIIQQFKKLDGKNSLETAMVINFENEPPKVTYKYLYENYTNFITQYQKEAAEDKKAKDQAAAEKEAKEEGEKTQAAGQVSATNNNNNSSATGGGGGGNKSSASILPVSQTVVDSSLPSEPQPNSQASVSGNSSSATGGGGGGNKSSASILPVSQTVVDSSLPSEPQPNSQASVSGSNSSSTVVESNLESNIGESPVKPKSNEYGEYSRTDRPLDTGVDVRSSAENRPDVKKKPVKMESKSLNTFVDNRISSVTPSSSSGGSSSSSGDSDNPVTSSKGVKIELNPSAVNLLGNVGRDKENDVKTELLNLNQKEIAEILEIYRRDVGKIAIEQQEINKIERIQKYLPMIIERQRQLNGENPLSEDEMKAYIRHNFPTAAERASKDSDIMNNFYDQQLAEINAAKTGGGNPNPEVPVKTGGGNPNPVVPVAKEEVNDPSAKKPFFSFPSIFSTQKKVVPEQPENEKVMTEVINAVSKRTPMNPTVNLSVLPDDVLNTQLTNATKAFVNTKGAPNQILLENMTLLLKEKYKRDDNPNEAFDELSRISAQQAESTLMSGGSKNKQKTLKNRRQRFNIRLV